jgi:hypothetical protein
MAGKSAVLSVDILVDAAKAKTGLDKAASGVSGFETKLSKLALPAAAIGTAVLGFGKSALSAASDAEQAMGGVETVFGKSADQVKAWGDQAATSAGLSSTEYATAAAKIGAQLKNAGVPMDQIADKTKTLIQQGADLSATYGGTAAEGVDKLSAALKGESDPAESLGLGLSAAAVAAEQVAEGTSKLTGKAGTAAKAQATMNLIAKQGAAAMGQFAAQSGTAGEKQQIAAAAWQNAAATLGAVLLPAASAVSTVFADVANWLAQNKTFTYALIGAVSLLAGGVLAVTAALKVYTAFQKIWSAATKAMAAVQWLLNAAMSANPIALIVIAVAALVAGIILLWNKSAAFRDFWIGVWAVIKSTAAAVWTAIKTAAAAVFDWLKKALKAVQTAAAAVWTAIQTAFTAMGTAVKAVGTAIQVALGAVWTAIQTAAGAVWTAIKIAAQVMGTAVKAVWTAIQTAAGVAWTAIKTAVQREIDGIKRIWEGLTTTVSAVWTAIVGAVDWAASLITTGVQAIVDAIAATWQTLTGIVQAVWDAILVVIDAAIKPITDAIEGIMTVWDTTVGLLSKGIDTVTGWLTGLFKKITGAPPVSVPGGNSAGGFAVSPALAGSPGLSTAALAGAPAVWRSAGGGPTIVVNGALDPDAVARQIRGILTGRDRRAGGVKVGGAAI